MGKTSSYIYRLLKNITYSIVFALSWSNLGQGYASNAINTEYELEHVGVFSADTLETKYGFVRFEASAQTRYAFDLGTESWHQRSVKLDEYYKPLAKGYIAPWKLIPTGGQDVITAHYEGKKAIDLSRVRFASAPNIP